LTYNPNSVSQLLILPIDLVHVDQEWRKRWFVLGADELACYRDSKDELASDAESVVSIIPDTVVSERDIGQGYAFHISVRLSSYYIMLCG